MLRILLAIFLLIPLPVLAEEVPGEVTVNEDFSDSTYQSGLTISGGNQAAYIYCNEQDRYGTTGCSLAIQSGTYVFEFSEDVYEIGFLVGAVNNSYSVKYYYSDNTDETINKSGQSNSNLNTMYDDFYKSFTDYNNDEANTDKFITKFEVTLSDISVLDTLYWQYVDESAIPTTTTTTTTTTSTTTTSTTTTTTTTTLPPPPPPPPPPEKVEVVMEDGTVSEYEEYEIEDGTVDRDNQRKANEKEYGCFMTDAQIERGDCDIPEEEPEEEVIIVIDEERDTKEELFDDDDVVLEVELEDEVEDIEPIKEEDIVEEEVKIDVKELEEEFKFEEEEIIFEDIPEDIVIVIEEEIVEEVAEEVLVEPIQEDVKEEPTEVVEVPEEVIVVQEITEEQVEEVQAVVDTAIENVEELTEEQVEVVAEVLQVSTEDVEIIAEAVKTDEVVAEAVEVYVERAVENADVENYTLADVVTEIQFEQFIENPLEVLIDFDDIDLSEIGNDMTQDQKEKAQEVVVPVILTRIATMAAFVFRRG